LLRSLLRSMLRNKWNY